ncbi:hypothetical protein [Acholeplasma hippikon]|uniref:Major membrane immunogen, membrane-anchored lipoprotein n=1 Tax=Acholeplasma hippikon TaxID=264636 RepID=A0A449BJ63_9MOLU|nr:hypothetical protein [Acholeplasma hippikon]VEU82357.1 Major membrane immunogen, membrane-anchored lipoprotein [Acholeplasma hippikon]
MKKLLLILLTIISVITLAGCSQNNYTYYFATAETNQDSAWVYYVVVTKKGNKIVDAEWNGYHIAGDTLATKGLSKYDASKAGLYNMSSDPTKLKWHEQADLITAKLIETQNYNDRIPVPAGATIGTGDFYALVEKALANGPIAKGKYQDGYYFFSNKENGTEKTSNNFYDPVKDVVIMGEAFNQYTFGTFIVVNGSIVLANYNTTQVGYRLKMNELNKIEKYAWDHDGNPETAPKSVSIIAPYNGQNPTKYLTKNQLGYSYGLKTPNGSSGLEYFEHAARIGEYLVENQTLPTLNNDGKFDDLAGVTITVSEYVQLLNQIPLK